MQNFNLNSSSHAVDYKAIYRLIVNRNRLTTSTQKLRKRAAKLTKLLSAAAIIVGLSACGDPVVEQIEQQLPVTEQRIDKLCQALENKQVRNANLIFQYADKLKSQKPEFVDLIDQFKRDATCQGPMYLALVDRINTAKNQKNMFASSQARFDELINIYQAADPVSYSDALSDPLNVLADMSDGQLPRVNSLSKNQSQRANNAQDFGVGEQLIGNPAYGQWQTGSNGLSFWEWYGMYALLDNVLDASFGHRKRRYYYSDWGRYRNYSYYHDYGRTRYSSPTQLRKQSQIETRTKKSFQRQGKSFTSAYSRNRTGASSLSSTSKSAQTSANKFRATNNASKSKYSKSASFRNSSNSTSRSFRRGK